MWHTVEHPVAKCLWVSVFSNKSGAFDVVPMVFVSLHDAFEVTCTVFQMVAVTVEEY